MNVAPASGRESASDQLHITSGDSRGAPNSCFIIISLSKLQARA
jgi:hypothetical protein